MKRGNTTTRDIALILLERDPVRYKAIIERAANNGYHDFKFDAIPTHPEYAECICPKAQIVDDLSVFPELNDIRKRVIEGDFDESPDDEDSFRTTLILKDENCPDSLFIALGFTPPTQQEREQWHKKKLDN